MRSDPYLLLGLFPSLRFQAVDALARTSLDVPVDAPERARAALRHCLARALSNGHCCVPRQRLLHGAAKVARRARTGTPCMCSPHTRARASSPVHRMLARAPPPRAHAGPRASS